MNIDENGAVRAILNASLEQARNLLALKSQNELLQRALAEHHEAVERLVQRQVNTINLTNEPEHQSNLIQDISAVHLSLQGVLVHCGELIAAIDKVTPIPPPHAHP